MDQTRNPPIGPGETTCAYIFGAVCPEKATRLAFSYANTEAIQLHLDKISQAVAKGAHAILLLDRAGWHNTDKLIVPDQITLLLLPHRSPELNSIETVWQYLRGNWLPDLVFEIYDDLVETCCKVGNRFTHQLDRNKSIRQRDWASGWC